MTYKIYKVYQNNNIFFHQLCRIHQDKKKLYESIFLFVFTTPSVSTYIHSPLQTNFTMGLLKLTSP